MNTEDVIDVIEDLKRNNLKANLLDDIPCGDQYPKCKFIKDAYEALDKKDDIHEQVESFLSKREKTETIIEEIDPEKVREYLEKYDQLLAKRDETNNQIITTELSLEKRKSTISELEERIGSQKYAEYQTRIQDSLKAVSQGQYVTARTKDEADAIQQFTQNPNLDISTVQGSQATRHKIVRMQNGFREAQDQIKTRTQQLYQLTEEERISELEEDRMETVYQLYEAKKRRVHRGT